MTTKLIPWHHPISGIVLFGILFGVSNAPLNAQTADRTGPVSYAFDYHQPSVSLTARLVQRVTFEGLDDPKMTLRDALTALMDTYDITIDLNEKAFRREPAISGTDLLRQPVATKVPRMQNVPLAAVLRAVVAKAIPTPDLTFIVRRDAVEITTCRQAFLDASNGVRLLLAEYAYRVQGTVGVDLQLYGLDAVRLVAEVAYWNHVMVKNAKAITVGAPARK